jgi:hypothetical protein
MDLYHGLTKYIKLSHGIEVSGIAGIRTLTKGNYFSCHRHTGFFYQGRYYTLFSRTP